MHSQASPSRRLAAAFRAAREINNIKDLLPSEWAVVCLRFLILPLVGPSRFQVVQDMGPNRDTGHVVCTASVLRSCWLEGRMRFS